MKKILRPIYEIIYASSIVVVLLVSHFFRFGPFFSALPPQHKPSLALYGIALASSILVGMSVLITALIEERKQKSHHLDVGGHKLRAQGMGMVFLGFLFLLYVYSLVMAIFQVVRAVK